MIGFQTVEESSATTERLGKRSPLSAASYLSGIAWRGWFVEGSIQAQAADEGDRLGESAAAIEELQRGISAIGDGYDLRVLGANASPAKATARPTR